MFYDSDEDEKQTNKKNNDSLFADPKTGAVPPKLDLRGVTTQGSSSSASLTGSSRDAATKRALEMQEKRKNRRGPTFAVKTEGPPVTSSTKVWFPNQLLDKSSETRHPRRTTCGIHSRILARKH